MTAATNLAGLEPKDLVIAGISIHYYVGGEGEPLLLLHGLAGSSGNWVELLPDLRPAPPRDRRRPARACRLGEGAARHEHRRLRGRRRCGARGRGRASRLSSPATPSVGSSRCGSHERVPSSFAACCSSRRPASQRRRASRGRSSSPRRRCGPAAGWRPCAIATPAAAWYRRAVFRPWFVSDATALSAARDARAARRAARAHGHEDRSAGDECGRSAPRPRRGRVPGRHPLGRARPAAAARRRLRVHAQAAAPSFASSPTAGTS